ncbi:MAG: DNA translocase FtsK [Candidatus Pacebacteria bacterium]|nr:DNA translocase FtsK [Candidatus Paceibacterota bacterium]
MAKKKKGGKKGGNGGSNGSGNGEKVTSAANSRRPAPAREPRLRPETKNSIWAISFLCATVILVLARFEKAGPAGALIYRGFDALLGWGYFILPVTLLFAAVVFLLSHQKRMLATTLIGSTLLILTFLGLVELLSPGHGGWLGLVFGSLRIPFGVMAAMVIDIFVFIISILVTANIPLKVTWPGKVAEDGKDKNEEEAPLLVTGESSEEGKKDKGEKDGKEKKGGKDAAADDLAVIHAKDGAELSKLGKKAKAPVFANYVPPPLSLLNSDSSKPTTGDLLAHANIIKRTLESFGIPVEMGEINVGPAVTRYTLKPAEGVKLSRITSLNSDLALSLAAHPIRIEAPIPGKSLVGIEVPNKAAALVRLGSLMNYPEFMASGPLGFVLGRDVSGEPIFANIGKMPHILVAGATGSGKSIFVHSLITSLLYKNSPATLRLVLIDPKRVELSIYDGIPHLITPVITENKKALGVLKWAIQEMDRRYEILQRAGCRDITSYNKANPADALPAVLIGIDEMADLMSSFGREVEGAIVRLAQMARATGIHLLLATQRPSVEVITGLIKANIPARVALQVASQIDSRTILDGAGAEKLLGHGDLLFLSAEMSKPKRIQGSYITEEELKSVVSFIKEHNKPQMADGDDGEPEVDAEQRNIDKAGPIVPQNIDAFLNGAVGGAGGDEDGDDLFDEALSVVAEAKKASASLLQRRLKVGYARAARLLDLMEAGDYIGPGDGAKPRDVNIEKIEERIS